MVPLPAAFALNQGSTSVIILVPGETAYTEDLNFFSVYNSVPSKPPYVEACKRSHFLLLKTPSKVLPHFCLGIPLSMRILPCTQANTKSNSKGEGKETTVTTSYLTLNINVVEVKAFSEVSTLLIFSQ